MAAISALRKTCLALALAATAGIALAATSSGASAEWGRGGGWHHRGGWHHGGDWHHRGGWGFGGGWHGGPRIPVRRFGPPRCHVSSRWVPGPYGWRHVVSPVCPRYVY